VYLTEETMNQAELDNFRRSLLALGNSIKANFSTFQGEAVRDTGGAASGSLFNAPLHLADLGTDNFQQEVNLSLLETEEQRLEEISEALKRLDQGSYGICAECQRPIDRDRLEALPYTRFCVECARRQEQESSAAQRPPKL
jgi:RNA polymerase-binding transcription factor DksA